MWLDVTLTNEYSDCCSVNSSIIVHSDEEFVVKWGTIVIVTICFVDALFSLLFIYKVFKIRYPQKTHIKLEDKSSMLICFETKYKSISRLVLDQGTWSKVQKHVIIQQYSQLWSIIILTNYSGEIFFVASEVQYLIIYTFSESKLDTY